MSSQTISPSNPLPIAYLVPGVFYLVKLIFPDFINEPSPLKPSRRTSQYPVFTTEPLRERHSDGSLTNRSKQLYSRVCLVVDNPKFTETVTILVCSTAPRWSYQGTERRWLPFEGSPHIPGQPPVHVETSPARAFCRSNSHPYSHPYLRFTHALEIKPVLIGSPLPAPDDQQGNAKFFVTKSFIKDKVWIRCLNMPAIKIAHREYWDGVRYNAAGDKILPEKDHQQENVEGGGRKSDGEGGNGGGSVGRGNGEEGSGGGNGGGSSVGEGSMGGGSMEEGSMGGGNGKGNCCESGGDGGGFRKRKISGEEGGGGEEIGHKQLKTAQVVEDIAFFPVIPSGKHWYEDDDDFVPSDDDAARMLASLGLGTVVGQWSEGYVEDIEQWDEVEEVVEEVEEDDEEEGEEEDEKEVVVEEEKDKEKKEDEEVGAASGVWGEEVDFDLEFISEPVPRVGMFFALEVATL